MQRVASLLLRGRTDRILPVRLAIDRLCRDQPVFDLLDHLRQVGIGAGDGVIFIIDVFVVREVTQIRIMFSIVIAEYECAVYALIMVHVGETFDAGLRVDEFAKMEQ